MQREAYQNFHRYDNDNFDYKASDVRGKQDSSQDREFPR